MTHERIKAQNISFINKRIPQQQLYTVNQRDQPYLSVHNDQSYVSSPHTTWLLQLIPPMALMKTILTELLLDYVSKTP